MEFNFPIQSSPMMINCSCDTTFGFGASAIQIKNHRNSQQDQANPGLNLKYTMLDLSNSHYRRSLARNNFNVLIYDSPFKFPNIFIANLALDTQIQL